MEAGTTVVGEDGSHYVILTEQVLNADQECNDGDQEHIIVAAAVENFTEEQLANTIATEDMNVQIAENPQVVGGNTRTVPVRTSTAYISDDGIITWETEDQEVDPAAVIVEEDDIIDTIEAVKRRPKSKTAVKKSRRTRNSFEEVSLGYPSPPTNFQCLVCSHYLEDAKSLTIHLRYAHSSDRDFTCVICEKKFMKNNLLLAHLRRHSGDKPHDCPYCEKSFADCNDLRQHRKTHVQDSKYRPPSLRKAKNFMCAYCNHLFPNPIRLKKHLVSHSVERNYACNKCGSSYKHEESLKNHWKRSGCQGGPSQPTGRRTLQSLYSPVFDKSSHDKLEAMSFVTGEGSSQDVKSMLASIIPEGVDIKDLSIKYTEQGEIEITLPSIETFKAITDSVRTNRDTEPETVKPFNPIHPTPTPTKTIPESVDVMDIMMKAGAFTTPVKSADEEEEEEEEEEEDMNEYDAEVVDDKIEEITKIDEFEEAVDEEFENMEQEDNENEEMEVTVAVADDNGDDNGDAEETATKRCRPYKCPVPYCRVSYTSQVLLDMHVERHEQYPNIICGICSENVSSALFSKHCGTRHTIAEGDKFKCLVCDLLLGNKRSMLRHVIAHTNMPLNVCKICNRKFSSSTDLKSHLLSHGEDALGGLDFAQFKCKKCGKRFSSRQRCRHHVRGVHLDLGRGENGAKFECVICSRQFKIKQQLRRHMTVHTPIEEKNYICTLCNKAYRHAETLSKHVNGCHPGYKLKMKGKEGAIMLVNVH